MKYYTNYLEHHGVKGQKWGVRRYQNYDGTRIKSQSEETKHTIGPKRYRGIGSIPKMSDVDILLPNEIPKNLKDAFGELNTSPLKSTHDNDCVNVFLAYEGRSRGLEVVPGYQSDLSTIMFEEVKNCFKPKDSKEHFFEDNSITSLKETKDTLSRYPDGSRGYISGSFKLKQGTFNHAICWSKENGEVSFGDGVNGLNAENYFHSINTSEPIKYFRSDDMDLNWRAYLQYVDKP